MKIYSNSQVNGIFKKEIGKYNSVSNLGVNPHLQWDEIEGAKEYVLMMIDYDSTRTLGFPLIHWLCSNIKTNYINENSDFKKLKITMGDTFRSNKGLHFPSILPNSLVLEPSNVYIGPGPSDHDHYYTIKIWAVDIELNMESGFKLADVRRKMRNHILDSGEVEFKYYKNILDYENLNK
ncbi:hypothetical protein EI74_0381 [Mycoplasma testudineum]|uniref:PBP family phospholipid-binding protein n=1 Tax=Mycoplasma testudineum TaxID=244584 RepID=A0A4R6IHG9_9MOLU|nr:YbhB/YbcL family Raf kinase inhibitor-like protein [Mycoplasma testudineum]OYD26997.1 hypothetical protein CG473_01530 [Mycoplasma testudineum]TDO20545.1 hypothetical protein EI74_0381 [Mycoplasma testudineum]